MFTRDAYWQLALQVEENPHYVCLVKLHQIAIARDESDKVWWTT